MPDWVIAVEALVVALLVHAVLFVLAGHQPEARGSAVPRSPGVTLWTRSGLPAEEWRKLVRWTEVHNPALIARADTASGYAALLEKHRERAVAALRAEVPLSEPQLPQLPGYVPLREVELPDMVPYRGGAFEERAFRSPGPVASPVIRDAGGRSAAAGTPHGSGDCPPGAAADRRIGLGHARIMRQHLVESSGVPELDRAALQAVACEDFKERRTIVIYWPEPAAEEEEETAP